MRDGGREDGSNRSDLPRDQPLPWYIFIPVAGYFLYLPQAERDFPEVKGARRFLIVLENTLLYFVIGVAGGRAGVPYSVWFLTVPVIVALSTCAEFWAIRRWGHRFRALGWHNIQRFGSKRFAHSTLYVVVQSLSFLTLGYVASRFIPR